MSPSLGFRPRWPAHLFLAELAESPTRYRPAELIKVIADLHGSDRHAEQARQFPYTAFAMLLNTLWAIAMVERSSLGSPTAVRLRSQTTAEELADVRTLWTVMDPRPDQHDDKVTAAAATPTSAMRQAAAQIAPSTSPTPSPRTPRKGYSQAFASVGSMPSTATSMTS
jgi:hypothetical protein